MSNASNAEQLPRGEGWLDLPVLPMRDTVLFPRAVIPLAIGRPTSVRLIESLGPLPSTAVFVAERDTGVEPSSLADLYRVGTLGKVLQVAK